MKKTRWRTAILLVVGVAGLTLVSACASDTVPTSAAAQENAADVPALPSPDLYAGSPYLRELRNELVYGEIWERPQLAKRDRSLITIAVLQALAREELAIHIPRGLDNGRGSGNCATASSTATSGSGRFSPSATGA